MIIYYKAKIVFFFGGKEKIPKIRYFYTISKRYQKQPQIYYPLFLFLPASIRKKINSRKVKPHNEEPP